MKQSLGAQPQQNQGGETKKGVGYISQSVLAEATAPVARALPQSSKNQKDCSSGSEIKRTTFRRVFGSCINEVVCSAVRHA
jgi:hypothetical protein